MTKVGITTTVPVEALLAAGHEPVDLNNLFISDPDPERLVRTAERDGFPTNCCTWIKGMYGVVMEGGIDKVVCVTTGDCSNTVMLMEVLKLKGRDVVPFAFPDHRDAGAMQHALESFAAALGTTMRAAEEMREELGRARSLAGQLDRLTWMDGVVSGWENHFWLVSTSDFRGDYRAYEHDVAELIEAARRREPCRRDTLRIAFVGVPAVFAREFYHFVEEQGARVVFNEVQRQFSMPGGTGCLADQYTAYTYPYSVFDRLDDIVPQLALRGIDGMVHYVQAFCHRGIGDIIFRQRINLPILTLEGGDDTLLSQHVKTRVEAFLDMIRRRGMRRGRARVAPLRMPSEQ
ncbi:MAG: 2-hydroxyacyl-CoA dehydratase [Chloroflexota bacterium]|nr:2-hydroxyacyl-CoA dehydratase [Chloroflexota bacterium]